MTTTMRLVGFVLPGLMLGLIAGGCEAKSQVGRTGPDGGSRPTGAPPRHAALTSDSKLDLLFLIDDSNSMAPLQMRLRQRMPES